MGSVIFFNKMGVGGFHERKKSSRGHNHQGSMLKAKYIKKKRSNEVLELDEPMSEIQLMPRSRPNQSSVTFQEGYHHVLTGRRAVTFACIGLVAAVIVIGMSFLGHELLRLCQTFSFMYNFLKCVRPNNSVSVYCWYSLDMTLT